MNRHEQHSTYLNGHAHGWPQDHSVDDAYDCPPFTWTGEKTLPAFNKAYEEALPPKPPVGDDESEYYAEFGSDGSARLCLTNTRIIAKFDTFADAKLAAEALNNLKGW